MDSDLAHRVRDLTLSLVAFPSINGTPGEAAMGDKLAEILRTLPARRPIEVSTVPADHDPLHRPVVFGRLRGRGGRTAVLMLGHYDVVDVQDFGQLRDLAFDPLALTRWYGEHGAGEIREAAQSGDYLFGRGVLDMKGGIATCIATIERLAGEDPPEGDLIVALAPDEEANSVGVKTVRRVCGEMQRSEGLRFVAALNTDSTSPASPQDPHRYGYTGSIGKLLPAVFLGAVPTHATRLAQGFADPAALLGRVLAHLTAHPDLVDRYGEQTAAPPVVLHVEDSRRGYDVQTLNWAWGYLNLLTMSRTPTEVMARLLALTREGLGLARRELSDRLASLGLGGVPEIPVLPFSALLERLRRERADADAVLAQALALPPDLDLRQRARQVVEDVWRALGSEPMAVVFFAQDIMPRVLSDDARLMAAFAAVLRRHGLAETFITRPIYQGISDMSFLAASPDDAHLDAFRADYPLAHATPALPQAPEMPMLEIGPSGFDPHQPTERVQVGWSFDTMPAVVLDLVQTLLA